MMLLAKLLGGSSLAAWLVLLGLISVGGTGAYLYVDHHGYARATVAYQAKLDALQGKLDRLVEQYQTQSDVEQRRQLDANTAAKAREADAIAADDAKELEITNLRKELADAASKDPDARKPALNADSVRRVNKIH